jgi:hypothetical protein
MIRTPDPRPVIILSALTILLIVGLVVSCVDQKPQEEVVVEKISNITEFTYQGCEYIEVGVGTRSWGSHKGNCKNPIHKQQ